MEISLTAMDNLRRFHVAAGTFYVGRSEPTLLQAFLGTCVGVALHDAQAGIGGIIHLLLPEPVVASSSYQQEKYASYGMPLFIQAAMDAGASKKNLKACIAGGALVGPVDHRDLALDIGGRTAEVARNILHQAGIAVAKQETGGFFSCCLTLDMMAWNARIEPAGMAKLEGGNDIHMPSSREIRQAMARLQPIPQVALKILRIIDSDDDDILKLADELRKDQVLSARTLQLCNSTMFARRLRVESLDHALVYLGRDLLVKMVVSASVNEFFDQQSHGYSLCKGGLYHHAVGTAIMAEKLAQLTGIAPPTTAYTAGLLHDIGKVVLDQYVAAAYPMFYREMQEDITFGEAEKRILGTDHTRVGLMLAEKWGFPKTLANAIRYHHCPEKDPEHTELTHIVHLADLLMSSFHAGLEMERLKITDLPKRLERVGLTTDRFAELVDMIPQSVFESAHDLNLEEKPAP
ncbi:MAG: HDOD domain-containing protein [Desulfobacterales bacterium]|nr:HDOD domain-containing protein [Desulfobacterales bacterium]